jgi:hypothetical protein
LQTVLLPQAIYTLSRKFFGPDIGTIKGETTRHTPIPVVADYLEIPPELITAQKHITLAINGMMVNSLYFLTSISLSIYYCTAHYQLQVNTKEHFENLMDLIRVYRRGGLKIVEMQADNAFRPLVRTFADKYPRINFNFSNPNEHIPETERNNRVIKERVCLTYH